MFSCLKNFIRSVSVSSNDPSQSGKYSFMENTYTENASLVVTAILFCVTSKIRYPQIPSGLLWNFLASDLIEDKSDISVLVDEQNPGMQIDRVNILYYISLERLICLIIYPTCCRLFLPSIAITTDTTLQSF